MVCGVVGVFILVWEPTCFVVNPHLWVLICGEVIICSWVLLSCLFFVLCQVKNKLRSTSTTNGVCVCLQFVPGDWETPWHIPLSRKEIVTCFRLKFENYCQVMFQASGNFNDYFRSILQMSLVEKSESHYSTTSVFLSALELELL